MTAGYLAAMVAIGSGALIVGKAAEVIPVRYTGLLGIVPLAFGIRDLLALFRSDDKPQADGAAAAGSRTALVASGFAQLANGADSIVTYSILFADSMALTDVLISITFVTMAAVFAAAALYALRHPWLNRGARRIGRYLTPLLMISVGAYVLANTGTDLV